MDISWYASRKYWADLGSYRRWKFQIAASASHGVPSWNVTPFLSFHSQVLPPSRSVQDSARTPTAGGTMSLRWRSYIVRPSNIGWIAWASVLPWLSDVCASSDGRSEISMA